MIKQGKLALCITVALAAVFGVQPGANAAELRNLPEAVKFSFVGGAGEAFRIETLAGKKISCSNVSGSGEFTSERLGKAEFKFTGCEEPTLKIKCTGLSDTTTGSVTASVEFHTRHLLPSSQGVNVAMLLSTVAHFSCSIVLFTMAGCVASRDLTTLGGANIVNLLLEKVLTVFAGEKGDQQPVSVGTDNSLGMENCVPLLKEGTGTAESSAFNDIGTIENFLTKEKVQATELVDLSGTT